MQNVPIAQVMTPAPATVEPGDSVATAERLMRERRCQHLPVVEGGRVVGMLGAHDLLKALVLRADSGEADSELLRKAPMTLFIVTSAKAMKRSIEKPMPLWTPA